MGSNENTTVHVSNVETPRRRLMRPFRFLRRIPKIGLVVIGIVLVLAIAGGVYWLVRPEPPAPIDEAAAAQKLGENTFASFEAQQKTQAAAPSPQQTFDDLQKKVSELPNPDDSKESLEWYIQAAFAGAQVQNPESKTYAAKALELYPTDPEVRAQNAGEITRLEAIARGDYAAAN